jgi:hypothetical protein
VFCGASFRIIEDDSPDVPSLVSLPERDHFHELRIRFLESFERCCELGIVIEMVEREFYLSA